MAKFCTNCGASLPDNRKFCTECGTPLAAPAAEPPAAPEMTSPLTEPDPVFSAPAGSTPEISAPEPAAPVSQPVMQQPAYYESAPAPAAPPQPVHQAPPSQPAYQAPAPAYGDAAPPKGSKYEPITAGGYIGIMLLMCIPLIGLILTIVWACGGCRKVNKRSLARATLIMMAVSLVLSLIIGIAGKAVFNSVLKQVGISSSQTTGLLSGLGGEEEESSGGLLSGLTGSKEKEEASDSGLLGGLGALAGSESGSSEVTNSDIEELEELGKLLDSLGALSGEQGESSDSGLSGLIDGAIEANRDAEAANDGWPKSLRPYPGGTATAVASYRTEISGTTEEEMLAYIEDLRGDGFVYTDFYDFGMSEQEMLDFAGWWATDGEIYLSISYSEGTVIIDHTYELPDLDSYF